MGKNQTGKNLIIMVFAKCSTAVLGFLTTMILSRQLSLFEYGTYSQLLLIVQLFVAVFSLGLPNSISYFFPKEDNKTNFMSQYVTLISLISIAIAISSMSGINIFCDYFSNNTIHNYIAFLCIYPWSLIIMNSMDNTCIVLEKTRFLAIYKILNSLLTACSAIIAYVYNFDLSYYLYFFIITQAFMSVAFYFFVGKNVPGVKLRIKYDEIKKILIFSIPIGLSAIVGTVNAEIDKLVISYYETTEVVAVYSNCSKELPFSLIATALTSLLLPKMVSYLSEGKKDKAIKLWNNSSEFSFLFMVFIVCLLVFYSNEVIIFLYSDKFLEGKSIFCIYSCLLLLRFTYFGMFLNAGGKTKYILFSSIVSILVNIVLDFLFYKLLGVIGPAIATLISQFVMNFTQLLFTTKVLNIEFRKMLPWKKMGLCLMGNFCQFTIFYYMKTEHILFQGLMGNLLILGTWMLIEIAIYGKKALSLYRNLD